ncbi:MAG: ImmA/IrrE family metallo-endopeptidase [Acidobacteriota bacterium]|jgi:HTH-type transcriptional regulator/antitoxin HigA
MAPKVIKIESQYEAALKRIAGLMDADPGTPRGDELELWSLLISDYEDRHYPMEMPDPIAAIRFRMEQQDLNQTDLIPYLGSRSKVSEVLSGRRPLSMAMIRKLHVGLGIPLEVLVRESAPAPARDCEDIDWRRFPLAEMLKRHWFPGFAGSARDLLAGAEHWLAPLLLSDDSACLRPALLRQHVRSGSEMNEYALWSWKARVLQRARERKTPRYQQGSVTSELISELAHLSVLDDAPLVARAFLEKMGIILVVERHLPRTHLDGAAMLRSDGTPIVGLTLRYDRLDSFWFTLSHELAHVALHLRKEELCACVDDFESESSDPVETAADHLAREALIPEPEWRDVQAHRGALAPKVHDVARRLRIHPAIVAGRLRRERDDYRILSGIVGQGKIRHMFS